MKFPYYFVLKGTQPVAELDVLKWSEWYGEADRIVARTELSKDLIVSTVFLGVDHNWGLGPPHLFETMIMGGKLDEEVIERYSTWDEAVEGHEKIVKLVRDTLPERAVGRL